jgi:hypothetical protein
MLSPDQVTAVNDIFAFLDDPTSNEHILTGSPGMGKSYLTSMIVNHCQEHNIVPILTATTNKATGVLESFYNTAALLGKATPPLIGTIHKVLNLRVQTDYVKNETKIFRNKSEPYLITAVYKYMEDINQSIMFSSTPVPKLLIIDEASMIDRELYSYIDAALNDFPDLKVLYVGDKNQLPPVNDVSVVFDPSYNIPVSKLTTVHRQVAGSTLDKTARSIEAAIENESWFIDKLQDAVDIEVIHEPTKFFTMLNEEFESDDFGLNPNYVRALAYRNKTVTQFNNHIRSLFYKHPDFQIGERLIVNKAYFDGDVKLASTEDIVTVASIRTADFEGVDGFAMELQNSKGKTFEAFYSTRKGKIAKKRKEYIDNGEYGKLMKFMENFIDVRPVYASTIHKSQGSTFDLVFLDLTDVNACKNYKEMAHLIFVALTSARSKVFTYGNIPEILVKK